MADERNDELSIEELDAVAGGVEDNDTTNESRCTTNNCPNNVAGCGGS